VGEDVAIFAKISATDMVHGGNTIEENVEVAKMFKAAGADVIHVSIGGTYPGVEYGSQADLHPGYIIPYSEIIRREADVPTATVGVIRNPLMAEEAVRNGRADIVTLGRALLHDPYWPMRAAKELDIEFDWPKPYQAVSLW
jgi:NADPH2 dehydrogenase